MPETAFAHVYPSKPLPPEIHPADTLENPLLKEVLTAWRHLCAGDAFPERPAAILPYVKPHIKRLHLSEVIDDGADFRFKIVGEAVFPGLGYSLGGQLVRDDDRADEEGQRLEAVGLRGVGARAPFALP